MATAFASVFPSLDFSTPTPQATPEIGFSSPGSAFGGFGVVNNAVEEALQFNRAWSIVTARLRDPQTHTVELVQAFQLLTIKEHARSSLCDWYAHQITVFFKKIEPQYQALSLSWSSGDSGSTILQSLEKEVDNCMLAGWLDGSIKWSPACMALLKELQYVAWEKWSSLVSSLQTRAELQTSITKVIYNSMDQPKFCSSQQCRCTIAINIPSNLEKIGLGEDFAERALAMAAAKFLSESLVDKRCFQVDWINKTSCAEKLENWIRSIFSPALLKASRTISSSTFTPNHIDSLVDRALNSLGKRRTTAMFDYIKVWPHSQGAIDDIKAYLTVNKTSDKAAVCAAAEAQIQTRLLHAGASTSEVLGIYVNLINVFKRLDARGVLLEKVSPVIRSYLRGRNDAVNVLARSLFRQDDSKDLCPAITSELDHAVQGNSTSQSMDWDDMNWTPDPIDAGLNHKSSKADDVLSHILSLFDQDEVIKEIESVLAEHLLSTNDPEITHETKLLELLKTRLDTTKMQNSEVMLKDIRDSVQFERRFRTEQSVPTPKEIQAAIPQTGITTTQLYSQFESRIKRTHFQAILKLVATKRSDMLFPKRGRLPREPEVEQQTDLPTRYRILSSSSWPQMQSTYFVLPGIAEKQLRAAEKKFSSLSGQRRLQWRPVLGRMSITLELEDRTIQKDDIPAWRAVVINAFANEEGGMDAEHIGNVLLMEEGLVKEALAYWTTEKVLYQSEPGVYSVLERLDMDIGMTEQDSAPEAISALKSQDAVLRENADMFEAFVSNMLSNGGPKEIGGMMGITNMMRMVLPTFTYGDDEVKWLLSQMKTKGLVHEEGEAWTIG